MAENLGAVELKRCSGCGIEKPLSEFYACRYRQCKECNRAAVKAWTKANPGKKLAAQRAWNSRNRARLREYDLRKHYGITQSEYDAMLCEQDGRCAICGAAEPGGQGRFHVDHDHDTDSVRGLLCHGCNTGLGLFADDPERLKRALGYLRKAS